MFSYGQRSKCADLLNSYRKTSSLETFRLISQPEKIPEMKFFSEKIRGLSNKEIQKRAGNRYYQCVSPPTILISCSYSTAAFTAASNAAVISAIAIDGVAGLLTTWETAYGTWIKPPRTFGNSFWI